jgi:hypothetical protein
LKENYKSLEFSHDWPPEGRFNIHGGKLEVFDWDGVGAGEVSRSNPGWLHFWGKNENVEDICENNRNINCYKHVFSILGWYFLQF